MPLVFDPAIIEQFFGTAGEMHTTEEIHPDIKPAQRTLWIEYAGPALKYTILLNIDQDSVSISGDTIQPFGAHSMYEIYVPCTEILAVPDPYRPEQTSLSFYYGETESYDNRHMTVMKRPDGELKVWPSFPFPPGHPCLSGSDSALQTPPAGND